MLGKDGGWRDGRASETTIDINAPPARIWAILTDFAAMPAWNPFIKSIAGQAVEGTRLAVRIEPPGKRGMGFAPTVLVVRPGSELRWRGQLVLPGIFDGEHYFLLTPARDDRTRFTQGEIFSGVLVGLFAGTLSATERGFGLMNAALKRRAESDGRAVAHA